MVIIEKVMIVLVLTVTVDINGFDREGFDREGYDKYGCDKDNLNREGKICSNEIDHNLTASERLLLEQMIAKKRELLISMQEARMVETHSTATSEFYLKEKEKEEELRAEIENRRQQAIANNSNSGTNNGENFTREQSSPNDRNNIVEIPSTTLVYAQLVMPVNSDYSDFVYAEIVGGPMDGTKLLGNISVPFLDVPYMPRDKLKITFNRMVYNRETIPINAIAIDYEEATNYMSSDVDYHYVQRWGGVVGGVMLQMLSTNYLDNEQEQDLRELDGLVNNLENPFTSNSLEATKSGLQIINDNLADIALQQFNRPPTIKKDGGMIGIFFVDEVNDDRVPVLF